MLLRSTWGLLHAVELFFGCSTAADCAALTRKSDLFYNLTKQLLGADVAVIQYNRGAVEQRKGLNHAAQTMTHDVAGPAWAEWPGCEFSARSDITSNMTCQCAAQIRPTR